MKLLWIDDDGEERFPYENRCLKSEGYSIVWARSGKQAAEKLNTQRFDVIFLDQQLPWVLGGTPVVWGGVLILAWLLQEDYPSMAPPYEGFEGLFKDNRSFKRTNTSLIFIISAFYEDAVSKVRLDLGVPDKQVVSKPLKFDELIAMLKAESK